MRVAESRRILTAGRPSRSQPGPRVPRTSIVTLRDSCGVNNRMKPSSGRSILEAPHLPWRRQDQPAGRERGASIVEPDVAAPVVDVEQLVEVELMRPVVAHEAGPRLDSAGIGV